MEAKGLILSNLNPTSYTSNVDLINQLPDELLSQIFSFLPIKTIPHINLVCRKWRQISDDFHYWKSQTPPFLQYFISKTQDAKAFLTSNYALSTKFKQANYHCNKLSLVNEETLTCFDVSEDLLFVGSNKGRILIYQTETMQPLTNFYIGYQKAVQALNIVNDKLYIAVIRAIDRPQYHLPISATPPQGEIQKWDWRQKQLEASSIPFNHHIQSMESNDRFYAIHTHEQHLFVGNSLDGTLLQIGRGPIFSFLLHDYSLYYTQYDGQNYSLQFHNLKTKTQTSFPLSNLPYSMQVVDSRLILLTKQQLLCLQLDHYYQPIQQINEQTINQKDRDTIFSLQPVHLTRLFDKLFIFSYNRCQIFNTTNNELTKPFRYTWNTFKGPPPKVKFSDEKMIMLQARAKSLPASLIYYDFKSRPNMWAKIQRLDFSTQIGSIPHYGLSLLRTCAKVILIVCVMQAISMLLTRNILIRSIAFFKLTSWLSGEDLQILIAMIYLTLSTLFHLIHSLISQTNQMYKVIQTFLYIYENWRLQLIQIKYAKEKELAAELIPYSSHFNYFCPISRAPIRYPVKLDGIFYERAYLLEWLILSHSSQKHKSFHLNDLKLDEDLQEEIEQTFILAKNT